ncbi:MAG: TraM recognition domain-containing protein, partial [Caldilineaceae bacterium]|nr:TraM recognition domain-containing protein [Caldilineaceae bacterium]
TLMEPYAPWLRVVLLAALDAMVRNRNVPPVPVLFVLDEFAQLGRFPEFRNAIRTHAGLGVRLWFFLQDIAAIEASYPNGGWRPFFNCEVKQFFGVNDPDTADLVGRYLGTTTKAVITTNVSTNSSSQQDGVFGDGGSIGNTVSSGEAIQFIGKPLMTADEVMGMLGAWHDDWRWGALKIDGPPAIQTRLVPWMQSKTCRERIGSPSPHAVGNDGN